MKELIGAASNVYFVLNDETREIMAQTEIILMVSEPRYIAKGDALRRRRDAIETMRFTASQRALAMVVQMIIDNQKEIQRQTEIIGKPDANGIDAGRERKGDE